MRAGGMLAGLALATAVLDWSEPLVRAGQVSAPFETGLSPVLATSVRWTLRATGRWRQAGRLRGNDRFRPRRTQQFDPYLPVGLLQSCPMLSARFSTFVSTKRPFVTSGTRPKAGTGGAPVRSKSVDRMARLLQRISAIDVELRPNCGDRCKIIAAIPEQPVIKRICTRQSLQARAPPRSPAPG